MTKIRPEHQRKWLAHMPKQDLTLNPHSLQRRHLTLVQDVALLREAIEIVQEELRDTNTQTKKGGQRYKALTFTRDVLEHLRDERKVQRNGVDNKLAARKQTVAEKRRAHAAWMRKRKEELRLSRLGVEVFYDLKEK